MIMIMIMIMIRLRLTEVKDLVGSKGSKSNNPRVLNGEFNDLLFAWITTIHKLNSTWKRGP